MAIYHVEVQLLKTLTAVLPSIVIDITLQGDLTIICDITTKRDLTAQEINAIQNKYPFMTITKTG